MIGQIGKSYVNLRAQISLQNQVEALSNYSINDLINLKRTNLELYKHFCGHAHTNLSQDRLTKFTLELIKLGKEKRINEEVQIIIRFTENLKFFKEINQKQKNVQNKIHEKICWKIHWESYPAGSVIFKQNDPPDRFYIIMKGGVNIYLLKSQQEIQQIIETNDQNFKLIHNYFLQKQPKVDPSNIADIQNLIYEQTGKIPAQSIQNPEFFFQLGVFKHRYLVTLGAGNMFGELGILMQKPRSASVVAQQDTDLAVLDSEYYRQILNNVELKKIQDRVLFFMKNFFHNLSYPMALKYCYNFETKQFKKDDLIYHEGQKASYVYIIKKGEIKFQKKLKIAKPKRMDNHQLSIKDTLNTIFPFELFCINEGQIFGEQEIIQNTPRQTSATCVSAISKVYQLSSEIFLRILKDSQTLRKNVRESVRQKQEWMEQRIQFLCNQREQTNLKDQQIQTQQNKQKISIMYRQKQTEIIGQNPSEMLIQLIQKKRRINLIKANQYKDKQRINKKNTRQNTQDGPIIPHFFPQEYFKKSKTKSSLINKSQYSMTRTQSLFQPNNEDFMKQDESKNLIYFSRVSKFFNTSSQKRFDNWKKSHHQRTLTQNTKTQSTQHEKDENEPTLQISCCNKSPCSIPLTNFIYDLDQTCSLLQQKEIPRAKSAITRAKSAVLGKRKTEQTIIPSRHNLFRLKPDRENLVSERYRKHISQ